VGAFAIGRTVLQNTETCGVWRERLGIVEKTRAVDPTSDSYTPGLWTP
jgi:hypothetical protein